MTLAELKSQWVDEESYHKTIHETFVANVEGVEWMNNHRNFIEKNAFGFGEKSFYWLWKLIVDEMPSEFRFLEIGVFRSQILCLIKMLASATGKKVERYGITPLDTSGGMWESDYEKDIETLHDTFFVPKDYKLIVGSSIDANIVEKAKEYKPYDIIYVDGSHDFYDVMSDLKEYPPLVKQGGYLVIDDAACRTKQFFGFFQGIDDVCRALEEWEKTEIAKEFEFQFNVVHLMIYKRK